MNFFKPKFWDKKQISLYSIFLLPAAIIIQLFNFIKLLIIRSYRSSIPVICVGNIYLGGTGKTPLCIELFSILKKLNKKPIFIRKKYNVFQDEINLLEQTGPIYQNSKRINALENAIKDKFDVAILDDGFQDFSIKKIYQLFVLMKNNGLGMVL